MSGSRASPASGRARALTLRSGAKFGWASAFFLTCAALSPLAAQQQPSAPISLFPPTVAPQESGETADEGAPVAVPQAPANPVPADGAPALPATETPLYEGIQVDKLQELDTESLGILEAEDGGLGVDAWAGSDRALVEGLIAALPDDPSSPTLRGLAVRLVLSNARAPKRASGNTLADAVAAAQETDFLRLRVNRLSALGDLAGLNRLLGIVPQRLDDSRLAQARVDGLLLAGRDQEACGQVRGAAARFPAEVYWSKALVFCQFLAEKRDQAFFALDLLREQDPEGDPLFYALTNLFIGGEAGAIEAGAMTPLSLAMLRLGAGEPPADLAAEAPLLLLQGIAALDKASPLDKAAALERLAQAALVPGRRLAEAYAAIPFEEPELADPLVKAAEAGGLRGRALLFHAARQESIATAKAEFLQAALSAARQAGRGFAMAQAVLPQVEALLPGAELAWFAPAAGRTLYRLGRYEGAAAWTAVLQLDGTRNPESQAAFEALKPYARLIGGGTPLGGSSEAEGEEAARLLLAMVLSRALGQDEPAVWPGTLGEAAFETAALEPLPVLLALGDAAAAGRRGEVVLLALRALGEGPLEEKHPLALGYAVSALNAVGLNSDARALALEAALAAGI